MWIKPLINKIKLFFINLEIRYKLLISFVVLVLVPVLLITFLSFQKSKSVIQKNSEVYIMDVLTELSKTIDLDFQGINRLYFTIFTNDMIQNSLRLARKNELDELTRIATAKRINDFITDTLIGRDDIESIYILSSVTNAIIVGYPYNDFSSSSYTLSDKQKDYIASGEGSQMWMDVSAGSQVVPCGRALNDLEKLNLMGYFIVNLKEKSLFDMYRRIKFADRGELYIINREGMVISHKDKSMLGKVPDYTYIEKILNGGERGFFVSEVNGRANYIAYCNIEQTGWKIVSTIPAVQYDSVIISLRDGMLLIALLCFLITVLFSLFLSDSISKPIRKLSQIMKKVGQEDCFDINSDYRSKDEVGILSENFNKMVERINTLIYKVYEEKLLKQRSELKYLKFQINPHFLYNTLDTINWAARIKGLPDVGDLAKALGDMMREAISGEDFIKLEKELQNINNYLTIQKYRYGDRFNVGIRVSERACSVTIPKLILQPLVENAIVHGIEMKIGPGTISIEGDVSDDVLTLSVTDNGVGIEPEKLEKLLGADSVNTSDNISIGVSNVNKRIKLYYGREYGIGINSELGSGTCVTIRIPASSSQKPEIKIS